MARHALGHATGMYYSAATESCPRDVDRIHRSDPVHYNYLTDTIRSDTVHSAVLDRICLIGSIGSLSGHFGAKNS